MAALPPDSITPHMAPVGMATAGRAAHSGSQVAARWAALQEAAAVVAALAGTDGTLADDASRSFPGRIVQVGGWRLRLVVQGMDDLSAILETGITALLSVNGRGGNAVAPACALWAEFAAAREGLIALCPDGVLETRRLG